MPTLRDVYIEKLDKRFNAKQDQPVVFRAVLCDSAGLTTGSGSVWANSDERLVWCRPLGMTNAGQVRCVRLEPELGLGVLVGVPDGSNELEVIMDDPFLRRSGNGKSYLAPNGRDFEPGGRLQMWLYSKAFVPLATLARSGLAVTVVAGDYEDSAGVRQSFAGSVNFDISGHQPAGPTEHLLVGIYISSSGAIGSVAGATVATSATAPEPSWPAGSVPLAVVDLDDSQTTINFADDISDRRLYFPYPGSGAILKTFLDAKGDLITATAADTPAILAVSGNDGYVLTEDSGEAAGIKWAAAAAGGYPFTVLSVDAADADADYSTIAAAITAASAGDVIEVGPGTYTEDVALNKAITIRGIGPRGSVIITNATATHTVVATAAGTLENLTINNTAAGTQIACVSVGATTNTTVRDCILNKTGASTTGVGYYFAGTGHKLIDTDVTVSGATTNHAVRNDTADGAVTITRGKLTAADASIYSNRTGTTVTLEKTILMNAISNSGTTSGSWLDSDYDLHLSGDKAGIKQRAVDIYQAITDHFDASALSGWTWAGYSGFVTPANINLSNYASILQLWHSSTTTRAFAYRATYGNEQYARLSPLFEVRTGIRQDDGTNDNYIEYWLELNASLKYNLRYRYAVGGSVTGPTTIISDMQAGAFYVLRMIQASNLFALYFGINLPLPVYTGLTVSALSAVSMTRSGIYSEHIGAGAPTAGRASLFDWYSQ